MTATVFFGAAFGSLPRALIRTALIAAVSTMRTLSVISRPLPSDAITSFLRDRSVNGNGVQQAAADAA